MAPGTEFARDFDAVIGPLQLGIVLVIYTIKKFMAFDMSSFYSIPQSKNVLQVYKLILFCKSDNDIR